MTIIYAILGIGTLLGATWMISQFFWQLMFTLVIITLIIVGLKFHKQIAELFNDAIKKKA